MIHSVQRWALAIGIVAATAPLARAADKTYPSAPVRIVVGFAAGGGTDIMGRVVADSLSHSLDGSFVVLNKPGAGAMVGADYVAKAKPDGYTLLLGTSAELTISPSLYGSAPYDPEKDFVPIAFLGSSPAILLANPAFPAVDIQGVLAEAKKNPGKLTIATGGTGTAPDLAAHQLKLIAGVNLTIAPYKGAGPSQTDAMAGHVPLVFSTVASALTMIKNHELTPLAVISATRSSLVPDIPSTAEAGLSNYVAVTWFAILAPNGTPAPVVDKLRDAIGAALHDPALKARFATLGIEPPTAADTPPQLTDRIRDERRHWADVIRASNISVD